MADLPEPLPASQWQHDMWTAAQLRNYTAAQVAEAVTQERERCASIAECYDLGTPEGHEIAAAIRATEASNDKRLAPGAGAKGETMDMHTTERPQDALNAVWIELSAALRKFPTWPTDPLHALAVLGEEFGELTKDVLQMTYEPGKTNAENVRKEAIQTAAMALRFVASLDAYIYKAGEQHRQEQWKAQQDAYAASGGLHPCYD